MVRLGQACQSGWGGGGGGNLNSGLSAVRSSVSAFLSLCLPHVQPMIMILTSDPRKTKPGVCALGAGGGGGESAMCLYARRTPACAEWRIWTFPGTASMMEGRTERRGVFLSSRFIFLPSSRTASFSTCLPFRPGQWTHHTDLWGVTVTPD